MAKTYEELLAGATQIKNNELPESNTHALVGGQLVDMVERQKEDVEEQEKKVTELENEIQLETESQLCFLYMRFYKEDGTLGYANGGLWLASPLISISKLNTNIDTYTISKAHYFKSANAPAIVFFDSNKKILSYKYGTPEDESERTEMLTFDKSDIGDAAYFAINGEKDTVIDGLQTLAYQINKNTTEIKNLNLICNSFEDKNGKLIYLDEITPENSVWISLTGTIGSNANVGTTQYIPVYGLKEIYYTGINLAPHIVALAAFYDAEYKLLSIIESDTNKQVYDKVISVPEEACFVRCCSYSDATDFYIKANVGSFANIVKAINNIREYYYNDVVKKQYFTIAMFEKYAIIGDSYASGEIASNPDNYGDYYDLSWGQIMARRNGNTCINLSVGGLTTKTWLDNPKGLALLQLSEPQQLYLMALGLNDASKTTIGTVDDIKEDSSQNPDTFFGNYARIIEATLAKSPKAKIIMITTFRNTGNFVSINNAIKEIAEYYSLPCIITRDDVLMASDYYLNNLVVSHPTAPLYAAMAVGYEKLISKCIYENIGYFRDYIGVVT